MTAVRSRDHRINLTGPSRVPARTISTREYAAQKIEQGQLPLGDMQRARDFVAKRLGPALITAAERLGYKVVADMWGCSVQSVSLKLRFVDRHYPKPDEIMSLLLADPDGLLRALCDEAGYEPPVRKVPSDAVGDLRATDAAIERLFGADVVDLIMRAAGRGR